jgi:hypothetical protein
LGDRFCALTVGAGAVPSESAAFSDALLLFPFVTPENHRNLLQHAGLEFHTLSIGGGSYANTIRLRFRQVFLPLDFGPAVDDLRLRGRFGILQRRFLARLRLKLGLLNLLLLERQCVLHRVCFRFGLQHAHRSLPLGLFHIAAFCASASSSAMRTSFNLMTNTSFSDFAKALASVEYTCSRVSYNATLSTSGVTKCTPGYKVPGRAPPNLTDAYAGGPVRNHHDAQRQQDGQNARNRQRLRQPPADRSERAACRYPRLSPRSCFTRLIARQQSPKLLRDKYVVDHQRPGATEQSNPENHQQILQSQHGVAPFPLTPGRYGGAVTANSAAHVGPAVLPAESRAVPSRVAPLTDATRKRAPVARPRAPNASAHSHAGPSRAASRQTSPARAAR